jgi:hypothetical protein
MSQPARLALVVPGLLPYASRREHESLGPVDAPTLQRLLARARPGRFAGHSGTDLVLRLFDYAADDSLSAPVAALSCLGDGGLPDGAWMLRLDPVHLLADRDRLRLFGAAILDVQIDEAVALCGELNEHFAELGWMVEPLHAQRWYLRLETDPGLFVPPLWQVTDGDLRGAMPAGEHGGDWRARLNEIQMLFHASVVNRRRELAGQLPINGVWIWGGGRLGAVQNSRWTFCVGSDPVLSGLASAYELPHMESEQGFAVLPQQTGATIVLLPPLETSDPGRWREAVEATEVSWLRPAVRALRAGSLQELALFTGDGCVYRIDRQALRRFWRRPLPLIEFCTQERTCRLRGASP